MVFLFTDKQIKMDNLCESVSNVETVDVMNYNRVTNIKLNVARLSHMYTVKNATQYICTVEYDARYYIK